MKFQFYVNYSYLLNIYHLKFTHYSSYKCESVSHSVISDSLWPPWTVALQTPLSMEFSRQEYWIGCYSFLKRIEPGFPALQEDSLLPEPPGKPYFIHEHTVISELFLSLLQGRDSNYLLPMTPWMADVSVTYLFKEYRDWLRNSILFLPRSKRLMLRWLLLQNKRDLDSWATEVGEAPSIHMGFAWVRNKLLMC